MDLEDFEWIFISHDVNTRYTYMVKLDNEVYKLEYNLNSGFIGSNYKLHNFLLNLEKIPWFIDYIDSDSMTRREYFVDFYDL